MARDKMHMGGLTGKADGVEAGDRLPGKKIPVGQHSKALSGFHDGHDGEYPHDVEPHIAHSPRTHHGDL